MPASKKRGKKPQGNPTRGFATTSSASKPRVALEVNDLKLAQEDSKSAEILSVKPKDADKSSNPAEDLAKLSPEDLEAHLERSELQILLEKCGLKSKKDASRSVSRLQTDRHLMRRQARPLHLSQWLSEELLQTISVALESQGLLNPMKCSGPVSFARDELLINVWTLKRALLALGFLEDRCIEAIRAWLDICSGNLQSPTSTDNFWGLDFCLEWLAMVCEEDELPGYDTHRTVKQEKQDLMMTQSLTAADPSISSSEITFVKDTESTRNGNMGSNPEADQDSESSLSDVSLSDLNPREILDRYLLLKSRLFKRRPDLADATPRKPKFAKRHAPATPEPADRKSTLLQRKIREIESDLLFDKEEAGELWAKTRMKLSQTEIRKHHVQNRSEQSKIDGDRQGISGKGSQTIQSNEADVVDGSDDDQGVALGELFATLPEIKIDEKSGSSEMTAPAENGTSIMIRDFGKSTGLSPRRALEEACRARDSSSRVSLLPLKSSSFSCRHSMTIKWSQIQSRIDETPIPGLLIMFEPRSLHLEMTTVATLDSQQSEAFLSTIALFLIFSPSPKEEKVYMRLPSAWRALWADLLKARQERLDSLDFQELSGLRKMVEEILDKKEQDNNICESNSTQCMSAQVMKIDQAEEHINLNVVSDPQAISQAWAAKVSTSRYDKMLSIRRNLPIWTFKEELLAAMRNNQTIIICGETGCGKSTQMPSFILENELSNGKDCKIYCTEPRRISAISLARRVSEELGEGKNDVGTPRSLVGYAIRLESRVSLGTKLVYATTGIVMRMLEGSNELQGITHLILDEVHERTIDSDFLLIVLRKLAIKKPDLRIILMSATVDAEKFSQYLNGAPVLKVPGRAYPVETRFLEDIIEETGYARRRDPASAKESESNMEEDPLDEKKQRTPQTGLDAYSTVTRNFIAGFDEYRIDYDLIVCLLEMVATNPNYVTYSKAILVFLPGMAEIRQLNDMLVGHELFRRRWQIHPLHSSIPTDQQEKAFSIPSSGIRKIVMATNIAETGITIPDVTCVIDTGKHKEMRFDERRQLSRLIETFISRANAEQRRGRAGRVQHGMCFHFFSRSRYDVMMAQQQVPEMLRLSLQDLSLRVKMCNLGGIEATLAEALDPPHPKNIRRAIDSLIEVRALTSTEELTPLGRRLAKLPLDVYLGKLILYSSLFRCLDAGLTIAAMMSSKSPFVTPFGARAKADTARLSFNRGDSDLLTLYNAYCSWRRVCSTTGSSEALFCHRNFLNSQVLSNIEDLKAQLASSLVDIGYLGSEDFTAGLSRGRFDSKSRQFVELPAYMDVNSSNDLITNSVIAWSFYPKILAGEGKGWRNVINNQTVNIHPSSVIRSTSSHPRWLSFYHIMQASSKAYNAHETSPVEDLALALLCGEAEFKIYSGVIIVDGGRLRFSVADWRTMMILKELSTQLRGFVKQSFTSPQSSLSKAQKTWYDIWEKMFTKRTPSP